MPAIYAHYCFGTAVLDQLDWPFLRDHLENHRDLFLAGLAGPDIFAYFEPLHQNPVRQATALLHHAAAEDFFGPAAEALEHIPSPDAGLAYLMGCICHFVLDNTCHEYIQQAGSSLAGLLKSVLPALSLSPIEQSLTAC